MRALMLSPTYINPPLTDHTETNEGNVGLPDGRTRLARMGGPNEITPLVLFLASNAANPMTGSCGRRS